MIEINLDMEDEVQSSFKVKENDDRVLRIKVYNSGVPYNLVGHNVQLSGVNPEGGAVIQSNNIVITDNTATITLDPNFTIVPGIVNMEATFIKNNKQITTFTFKMIVRQRVLTGANLKPELVIDSIEMLTDLIEESKLIFESGGAVTKAELDNKLALKVDKSDSRLETNDKSVIGAINEINAKSGGIVTVTEGNVNQPFTDSKASKYSIDNPIVNTSFENYNEATYGIFKAYVTDNIVNLNGVVNKITNGYHNDEPVIAYLYPELAPGIIPVANSVSMDSTWRDIKPQLLMIGSLAQLHIDSDVYIASGFLNKFLNINMNYAIDKFKIPQFLSSGFQEKINIVNGLSGSKFVYCGDLHCNPQQRQGKDNKHIYYPRAINYLGDKINSFANFVCGDVIDDTNSTTKFEGLKRLRSMRRLLSYKTLCIRGNHDGNGIIDDSSGAKFIHADEYRIEMLDGKSNIIKGPAGKACYYVDDVEQNIRYVCLDGCDAPKSKNPSYTYVLSQVQLTWLNKVLTATPNGYHVVFLMHQSLLPQSELPDLYDLYVNNANLAKGMIEAFNNKTTFTGATTGEFAASISVDYRELDASIKVVGFFSGHYHYDYAKRINGIWHIGIDSAYTEAPYNITIPEASDNARAAGTITEVVFDLVNVNTSSRKVDLIRAGAGNNRSYTY